MSSNVADAPAWANRWELPLLRGQTPQKLQQMQPFFREEVHYLHPANRPQAGVGHGRRSDVDARRGGSAFAASARRRNADGGGPFSSRDRKSTRLNSSHPSISYAV